MDVTLYVSFWTSGLVALAEFSWHLISLEVVRPCGSLSGSQIGFCVFISMGWGNVTG